MTYAKCFGTASGRRVTLNARECLKSATVPQRQCHEDMLKTRHRYVAHAGDCEEQQSKTLLVLNPDRTNKSVVTFAALSVSAVGVEALYLDRCIDVMRLVLSYVQSASKKTEAALRKAIDAEPLDKWYSKAVLPRVSGPVTLFPKRYIEVKD